MSGCGSPEQAWGPLHAGAGARLLSHAHPRVPEQRPLRGPSLQRPGQEVGQRARASPSHTHADVPGSLLPSLLC